MLQVSPVFYGLQRKQNQNNGGEIFLVQDFQQKEEATFTYGVRPYTQPERHLHCLSSVKNFQLCEQGLGLQFVT